MWALGESLLRPSLTPIYLPSSLGTTLRDTRVDPSHWKIIPQRRPARSFAAKFCRHQLHTIQGMSDNTILTLTSLTITQISPFVVHSQEALARKNARQRALQRLTEVKIIGAFVLFVLSISHLFEKYAGTRYTGSYIQKVQGIEIVRLSIQCRYCIIFMMCILPHMVSCYYNRLWKEVWTNYGLSDNISHVTWIILELDSSWWNIHLNCCTTGIYH